MAITRQDYKFIHNTLEKGSGKQDDGELKLGAVVKNLITDLSLENIINMECPEYYSVNKSLTTVWYPPYKVEGYEMTESVEVSRDKYEFEFSYDGRMHIIDVEGNFLNKYNYYYNQDLNKTFLELEFDEEALLEEGLGEEELRSLTIKVLIKYEKRFSENEKTISKGELHTQVSLKPNTTYVLQVINSVMPSSNLKPENKLICTSQVWEFENYLFFKTPDSKTNLTYTLKIQGVSFGYEVIGVDNTTGSEIALRCFASEEKPKAFLFQTNTPWIVDDKGVIISSSMDTNLGFEIEETAKPITLDLSESQAIEMFSLMSPSIQLTANNELTLSVTNSIWKKYKAAWKQAYEKSDENSWIRNFVIIVYRDTLIEEYRWWNWKKYKKRYGIVRTMQDVGQKYKLQVILPSVEKDAQFCFKPSTQERYFINDDNQSIVPLNMSVLGACLGSNYEYEKRKNIENSQYTSIAFAWGRKTASGIECLSPKTKPIIIDRNLFSISKRRNQYVITTSDECYIRFEESNSYYPMAYYVKKL